MLATGRPGVLAFEGGYHGLTYGALDATARPTSAPPSCPSWAASPRICPTAQTSAQVEDHLRRNDIGAVLAEPIQGRGGIVVPPPGWLRGLRDVCDRAGALLILDEIFTGWGRTGAWFACQSEGVVPDILCIGKAMGGGLPISACVASESLMACWASRGARPCTPARSSAIPSPAPPPWRPFRSLEDERLPERAAQMGAVLSDGLRHLQQSFPDMICRRARARPDAGPGDGLSRPRPVPRPPRARAGADSVYPPVMGSVLELVPPLTIHPDQIAWCLSLLHRLLPISRPAKISVFVRIFWVQCLLATSIALLTCQPSVSCARAALPEQITGIRQVPPFPFENAPPSADNGIRALFIRNRFRPTSF